MALFGLAGTLSFCSYHPLYMFPAADGGLAKALLLHVAALSTAGAVAAAAALVRRRLTGACKRKQQPQQAPAMAEMPRMEVAESGRLENLEKFSHYVGQ
jgi:hypothetical protein